MGSSLLLYTLAFVPPPTGWLLSLPDTPVYLIFAAALFWSASALAMPPDLCPEEAALPPARAPV